MNYLSMEPFGMSLLEYFEGNPSAELILRRDDGKESIIPASIFFREECNFSSIEKKAIELSKGQILDIGAGTGSQSLALVRSGHKVTSIDISPQAVSIMNMRGLKEVHCCDIFQFQGRQFDTLLMLGHGIGLVETIEGLDRFLTHAHTLLSDNGQIILDSLDVRKTDAPDNLKYHETNRKTGRYIGEIKIQFEFNKRPGPYCGWLQIDPETLKAHAGQIDWLCETICQEENGNYLARLIEA